MRFMRSSDSTTPPASGTVAPVVLVPRPRTVSGTRAAWQAAATARTSSWDSACATACGMACRRLLS